MSVPPGAAPRFRPSSDFDGVNPRREVAPPSAGPWAAVRPAASHVTASHGTAAKVPLLPRTANAIAPLVPYTTSSTRPAGEPSLSVTVEPITDDIRCMAGGAGAGGAATVAGASGAAAV